MYATVCNQKIDGIVLPRLSSCISPKARALPLLPQALERYGPVRMDGEGFRAFRGSTSFRKQDWGWIWELGGLIQGPSRRTTLHGIYYDWYDHEATRQKKVTRSGRQKVGFLLGSCWAASRVLGFRVLS